MKKLIYLFSLTLFIACQNSNSKKPLLKNEKLPASIDEESFIELGGEKQYVEIKGTSPDDPVLLFLHGGPGWPQTPYLRYFNADLTKKIILVSWDQSGCGKSFIHDPNPKNLTLEQIIKDGHELTLILKKKFNKDKIYLAGFSWGSVVGLHLIEKYPEDYAAYFGISQVINLRKGVKLSREWIKEQANKNKDTATLKILGKLDKKDTALCKTELDCFLKQYEQLSKYHGAIHDTLTERKIDTALAKYDDYKNYDWMGGFRYSASRLEKDLFSIDLSGVKELKVPVYFFTGRHDWNVPTIIIQQFVNDLKAPKKEIVWFENSGHEPLEEEAGEFNKQIIERIMK